MSTAWIILLIDARDALRRRVAESCGTGLAKTFASWFLQDPSSDSEFASIVAEAATKKGAQQDFQTVAILGFAADCGVLGEGRLDTLKEGIHRQAGRAPMIDGVPMPFCTDAVGILGVILGTKALADVDVKGEVVRWISGFLRDSYEMERSEEWQRCLFAVSDRQLGSVLNLSVPMSSAAADVRVALVAKGLTEAGGPNQLREDRASTLTLANRGSPDDLMSDRAVLRLAAINSIIETVAPVLDAQNCGMPGEAMEAGSLSQDVIEPAGTFTGEVPPMLDSSTPKPDNRRGPRLRTEGTDRLGPRCPTEETRPHDAEPAKRARAKTVARLVQELNDLKPQMFEDESEYIRLRDLYPGFLTFEIAERRPDLKTKVLAIQGSTRHIRLAQELAGAHHGRELSTIQDDWKDFKPPEFRRPK
jgi:hypothetical protein